MNVPGCARTEGWQLRGKIEWIDHGRKGGNIGGFEYVSSHDIFATANVERERLRRAMEHAEWSIVGRVERWTDVVTPNKDMAAGIQILADKYGPGVVISRNYRSKVTKRGAQLPDVGGSILGERRGRRSEEFSRKAQGNAVD